MKTFVRQLAILFASFAVAGFVGAQATPLASARGKVLLLDNDRILEGDIEKFHGQYRIRREAGELWIPAARVKRLCGDLVECYDAMKREANLKDPDERLRLARWCQLNGLKSQALNEARAALDMRPDHVESLNLVKMFERLAIAPTPAASKTPAPGARLPVAPRSTVDVSNEAFVSFATKVQPILMNACASCHAVGKGGGFALVRSSSSGSRAAAQTNLNAALEFVNLEKTVLSPLLIKSVVAHGGSTAAPLKGRQSTPFQTMQSWVDQLVEGNPHLKELRHAEMAGPSTSARKDYFTEVFAPPAAPPPPPSKEPVGEVVSRPVPREDNRPAALPPTASPPAIAPAPMPRDPFDPSEFNSRPK